ncbi:hypothetical protein PanWU01x14_212710, partial [Parasponia andersonii]
MAHTELLAFYFHFCGPEPVVIDEIVENILDLLNGSSSIGTIDENLVGMDSRTEKMFSYLEMEMSNDGRT